MVKNGRHGHTPISCTKITDGNENKFKCTTYTSINKIIFVNYSSEVISYFAIKFEKY